MMLLACILQNNSINSLNILAQITQFSQLLLYYLVKQLMAHFVLFVLLFAGQVIGGFSTQRLPPSNNGNLITILSVDGGGIKGIIPATVLIHLDKALKVHSYCEYYVYVLKWHEYE